MIKSPDGKQEFSASGIEIPGNPDQNLCLKAWQVLQQMFKLPAVKIHLHKAIPAGAGLGGGSSDAAFMIKLANQEFGLNLSVAQMQDFAVKIGSDCPFFIENKPVFAFEKGDRFIPVISSLSGYFVVIVKPEIHINTAGAYAGIIPKLPAVSVEEIIESPVEYWKDMLVNDFEEPAIINNPSIGTIKNELYRQGAVYASMTGSGSAVYGIFRCEVDLLKFFSNTFYWGGWF
jgi:4-diphosphocytidyl-2-C-methyl-D-erythritol kinase